MATNRSTSTRRPTRPFPLVSLTTLEPRHPASPAHTTTGTIWIHHSPAHDRNTPTRDGDTLSPLHEDGGDPPPGGLHNLPVPPVPGVLPNLHLIHPAHSAETPGGEVPLHHVPVSRHCNTKVSSRSSRLGKSPSRLMEGRVALPSP